VYRAETSDEALKKAKLLTHLDPLRSVAGLCGKKWQDGPWLTWPKRLAEPRSRRLGRSEQEWMGMMFRGQFEHAIDAKGRTSLPSRFRDVLGAASDLRLILTRAVFDRCLHLYPLRGWEELEAKIADMPQFDPNVVAFRRMYLSAAVECELDKQGRILVPPSLREHAELQSFRTAMEQFRL
jgi:MraZ protein